MTMPRCLPDRLGMVIELAPASVGAEISVYRGDFAAAILGAAPARLYLVDPWAPPTGNFKNDTWSHHDHEANYGYVLTRFTLEPRVTIMRTRSLDAAAALEDSGVQLDWVYIDACHAFEDCLQDLRAWSRLLRTGGALMGHDFVDDGTHEMEQFGVHTAVERFADEAGWRLDTVACEWPPSYKLIRV